MWRGCGFLLFIAVISVNGQRLRETMYEHVSGVPCYRRLNGTHQFGCASLTSGSIGVLHAVSNLQDVEWILKQGKAGPYIPILPVHLFNLEYMDKFIANPDIIAGVFIYHNGTNKPETFSHERQCPNEQFQWNMENSCSISKNKWNSYGTGLMYKEYPFPMFYLPSDKSDDIKKIFDCYYRFNAHDLDTQTSRSLCAVEMSAVMFASGNSEVCIRRSNIVQNLSPTRFCDPLGDRSAYTTLFPRESIEPKSDDNEKVVRSENMVTKPGITYKKGSIALVTAPLDSTSMFDNVGVGAVTTITGLVTLLTTAHTLNSMLSLNTYNTNGNNVLFVALNGEAYDYIGSQRMAWDLLTDSYPFKSSNSKPIDPMSIGHHIHLGQISQFSEDLHVFAPVYNESERNEKVSELIGLLNESIGFNLSVIKSNNLPPSSLHSFLRLLNSSVTQMDSIMLADHDITFRNKFYQSMFDDKMNVNYSYFNLSHLIEYDSSGKIKYPDSSISENNIQTKIAKVSTSIAQALFTHVTGLKYTDKVQGSPFIADELLHCYLETISCPIFTAAQLPVSSPPVSEKPVPPITLYVGASTYYYPAPYTTAQLLNFLSGKEVNKTKENCKILDSEVVDYLWVAGWNGEGMCLQSYTNFSQAVSPAFVISDYDFASGKYSTWTESVWKNFNVRILIKAPKWRERLLISLGCTIFAISFILVHIARKHLIWLMQTVVPNENEASNQPRLRVDC